jgi:hypothetical protein
VWWPGVGFAIPGILTFDLLMVCLLWLLVAASTVVIGGRLGGRLRPAHRADASGAMAAGEIGRVSKASNRAEWGVRTSRSVEYWTRQGILNERKLEVLRVLEEHLGRNTSLPYVGVAVLATAPRPQGAATGPGATPECPVYPPPLAAYSALPTACGATSRASPISPTRQLQRATTPRCTCWSAAVV